MLANEKRMTHRFLIRSSAFCTAVVLSACDVEPAQTDNAAPFATNVHILYGAEQLKLADMTGERWTEVELTGAFTYNDAEQDEADTANYAYRWLVNGETVSNELTFTPTRLHSAKDIQFEVTPAAKTGTPTGTAAASSAISLINKEKLFFTATPFDDDQALYVTDGSVENTQRLASFKPSTGADGIEFITRPVAFADKWIFTAKNAENNLVLGVTDATPEGTYLLDDGVLSDLLPSNLIAFNDAIYFRGYDANSGYELWRTDGTTAGTYRVADINQNGSSYADYFAVFQGELYFAAREDDTGYELYKINPQHDVSLVKDIYSGQKSSMNSSLFEYQQHLYFAAQTEFGIELWRTDGSETGTVMVADINPTGSAYPNGFVIAGDALYFLANSSESSRKNEVWKTLGMAESTVRVSAQDDGSHELSTFQDMVAYRSTNNMHIAVPAGTETDPFASDIIAYSNLINTGAFLPFQNKLLFSAAQNDSEFELRMIHAEDPATILTLANLNSDISSFPKSFVELNQNVLFTVTDIGVGQEIWTTDGTPEGTRLFIDLLAGEGSSSPNLILPIGSGER